MNRLCARMFGLTLFGFLVFAIAVQPAMAQQDQATHVFHRLIQAGRLPVPPATRGSRTSGKPARSARQRVECTVCHGAITAKDFAGKPG